MFILICVGHFSVSATELESSATMEESAQDESLELEEQNAITEEPQDIETHTDALTEIDDSDIEDKADLEELVNVGDDKEGLYYYLQQYQCQCLCAYLDKNMEYIDLQLQATEQMYALGDATETIVKSYRAQKALIESELQIAQNESDYYGLYLGKNGLDYSDYDVREMKDIESIDYYIENYPEKDYMTMARYVTDYKNAVSGIEAKKAEISYLEEEVKMATILFNEGEISKLEMTEKEVSLAKAQYELEQQYVAMNVAYLSLPINE